MVLSKLLVARIEAVMKTQEDADRFLASIKRSFSGKGADVIESIEFVVPSKWGMLTMLIKANEVYD